MPAGVALQRGVGVEAVGGFLEAVAADEPHRVVGAAVGIGSQAVDRDDPGVLKVAGDFRLQEEPLAAGRVVGVAVEDLFQCDFAVEFSIQRDEDGAQATLGVGPEDGKPIAVGPGRANGVGDGAVNVGLARAGFKARYGSGQLEVAQGGKASRG